MSENAGLPTPQDEATGRRLARIRTDHRAQAIAISLAMERDGAPTADELRDRLLALVEQLDTYAREDAQDANDKRLPERRRWYRIGCADSYQKSAELLRQVLGGKP